MQICRVKPGNQREGTRAKPGNQLVASPIILAETAFLWQHIISDFVQVLVRQMRGISPIT